MMDDVDRVRPMAKSPLNATIREYVAREAVRRYGDLEPRLPLLLRRNIRRNTGVFVDQAEILRQLQHYKRVYRVASSLLPRFLNERSGRYSGYSDVRVADLVAALASEFPEEPVSLLQIVADYCIYYDYLR